jgi:hypothetical protein
VALPKPVIDCTIRDIRLICISDKSTIFLSKYRIVNISYKLKYGLKDEVIYFKLTLDYFKLSNLFIPLFEQILKALKKSSK